MSYLLRNQHRLSSKPGGLGSIHNSINRAPSSLQRSSLGIPQRSLSTLVAPGGGGQVQIQRQHHAQPPPQQQQQQQQQQRVQGVISMEEGKLRMNSIISCIVFLLLNHYSLVAKTTSDG